MPFKKSYSRRKSRKGRKKYSRKSRAGMGQGGKRFFKIRSIQNLTTTVGGIIDQVFTDNPAGFNDWSNIAALFDEYKFAAYKIKYIPNIPNDTTASISYRPVFVVADDNDTTVLGSGNTALQYENCKVMNLFRPWKFYHKFGKLTSDGTSAVVNTAGYRAITSTGGVRGIKMVGDSGLTASTTYGRLVLTAYITCKNRV